MHCKPENVVAISLVFVEIQVDDFWHDLERAANEQQRVLITCINKQLDHLSASIEETVGEMLDVRLEPVNLRMAVPSSQEFHDTLAELFTHGRSYRTLSFFSGVLCAQFLDGCECLLHTSRVREWAHFSMLRGCLTQPVPSSWVPR
jgi:hypothetical protein